MLILNNVILKMMLILNNIILQMMLILNKFHKHFACTTH